MKTTTQEKIMLTEVLHPSADTYLGAVEYVMQFGTDATGKRRARCPFCMRHAVEPQIEDGHANGFVHRERTTSSLCPLVTQSAQPLALRIAHERNATWHRRHRAAFIEQWAAHYRLMRDLVPTLTVDRLIGLVSYADVVSLWSHPALVSEQVAYVLLALGALIAEGGDTAHMNWVRFVFDGTVRSIDDLWTGRAVAPRLFRIRYRTESVSKPPMARDIIACDEVRFEALVADPHAHGVSVHELARFNAFVRGGDGLGLGDERKEESSGVFPDPRVAELQSLESYAVSTMRAYARKRGRTA